MTNKNTKQEGGAAELLWSETAITRLERVPAGSIRDMARRAVNTIAMQSGLDEISEEFVEQILGVFKKGSTKVTETLLWDDDARAGINRAPEMVRGMLVQEIESWAKSHAKSRITADVVKTVKAKWSSDGFFHLDPNDPRAGS